MRAELTKVGIVGSGIMGSGVAEVAAKAGYEVVVRSRTRSGADAVVAAVAKSLGRQVDKGKLSETDRDLALANLSATDDLHDLEDCDLVLESVAEDLAVKKELFGELDRVCKPHTLLATNTSTLSVV
jgi:3-hydroxybutyryl-CoA dehydrogenase